MKYPSYLRMMLLGTFISPMASFSYAQQTPIDIERENIIIFSRQGDAQLHQAITQLEKLFSRTQDNKVRDDLIALYLRTNQSAKALAVCSQCVASQFSESELENLGRAARNEKQFTKAFELYSQLQQKYPQNANGWLGRALSAIELKNYPEAKRSLDAYQKRFGKTEGFIDAQNYYLDGTEPDMAKLGRWQRLLNQNPKNTQLVQELYRLASRYNLTSLQDKLQRDYPELFNQKDQLWLMHDRAIMQSKGDATIEQSEKSFSELTALLQNLDKNNPLYLQTVEDRFVLGARLGKYKEIESDLSDLETQQDAPAYLVEAIGDYYLAKGSPHKALSIYQKLEQQNVSKKQKISDGLLVKLSNAASDAGKFPLAQYYMEQVSDKPYINDYTHTSQVVNPSYDARYFGLARLALWRGNSSLAQELIDTRAIEKTPGDPWVMLEKAELERARYHFDDAREWTKKAELFLNNEDKQAARNALANIAITQGDLSTANSIINNMTDSQKRAAKGLVDRYEQARAGRIVGGASLQHRTSPASESNESAQNYAIYSPKTANGHDIFARYQETRSPNGTESLVSRRLGVGTELNFYPFSLKLESGKGIKLNDKFYFSAEAGYTLNQHWQFYLNGNINGSDTPVKAINQGVYTKDIGASAIYTHSERLQAGGNANVMKFDDGNLRQAFNVWANATIFKYDRITLTNSLRFDCSKNKTIANAEYYNPSNAKSLELGADLSYFQPFEHQVILTHHLKGSVGAYKQAEQARERTWSISYGHEWNIAKKYGISYEIGRKKNLYDGDAEYNNFGNLNFSIYY